MCNRRGKKSFSNGRPQVSVNICVCPVPAEVNTIFLLLPPPPSSLPSLHMYLGPSLLRDTLTSILQRSFHLLLLLSLPPSSLPLADSSNLISLSEVCSTKPFPASLFLRSLLFLLSLFSSFSHSSRSLLFTSSSSSSFSFFHPSSFFYIPPPFLHLLRTVLKCSQVCGKHLSSLCASWRLLTPA